MDRLQVDTALLRLAGTDLRRVAAEFAHAGPNSEQVAAAIPHRGLAGAVREFSDNWDNRRQKMLGDLAELAAATLATADGIDQVDRELGRALLGQGPSPPGRTIRSGGAVAEPLRVVSMTSGADYRPLEWTPLAQTDPVPGDPAVAARAGAHYSAVAEAIRSAATKLRHIAADSSQISAAVTAIRVQMGQIADDIARAEGRYDAAGQALGQYASEFTAAQAETVRALVRAREAQDLLTRAADRERLALLDLVPPAVDSAELRAALLLRADAEELMRTAQRNFVEAVNAHQDAGARAERHINDGRAGDGLGDSRWDNLKGAVVDVLHAISGVADLVAMGAGVLALITVWCPPVSAFFGAVATYATVVSLASKLLLQTMGEDMWAEIAWSVAGLAALALGRVAIGAFRTSAAGAQGAARAAAGRAAATEPAKRAGQGLPAHSSSGAAIRAMLGTSSVPSRHAATEAALRSLDEGLVPSVREILGSLRALPAETLDELRAVRHLDLRAPIAQLQANTVVNPLAMMGQAEASLDLRQFLQVHQVIQGAPEVAPHVQQMLAQRAAFTGVWFGGQVLFGVETFVSDGADRSAAERLNLTGAGG